MTLKKIAFACWLVCLVMDSVAMNPSGSFHNKPASGTFFNFNVEEIRVFWSGFDTTFTYENRGRRNQLIIDARNAPDYTSLELDAVLRKTLEYCTKSNGQSVIKTRQCVVRSIQLLLPTSCPGELKTICHKYDFNEDLPGIMRIWLDESCPSKLPRLATSALAITGCVVADDHVVVVEDRDRPGELKLFTGHVDDEDETDIDAARREGREECGDRLGDAIDTSPVQILGTLRSKNKTTAEQCSNTVLYFNIPTKVSLEARGVTRTEWMPLNDYDDYVHRQKERDFWIACIEALKAKRSNPDQEVEKYDIDWEKGQMSFVGPKGLQVPCVRNKQKPIIE